MVAPAGGTVLRREALPGMRVEAGATLFEIADLSTVWVLADVYAAELPEVAVGAEASIERASDPGRRIPGRIGFVPPTIAEATRTARVRIEVPNADGGLRPGEYATVRIASDLGPQIVVGVDAVLDTGTRQLTFVETGEGRFEPREISLGARSGGEAVVLAGLREGERVVDGATFLVDSESRLRSTIRGPAPASPAAHAGHGGR